MAILIPAKAKCDGALGECGATCDIMLRVVNDEDEYMYVVADDIPEGWDVVARYDRFDTTAHCSDCNAKIAAMKRGVNKKR